MTFELAALYFIIVAQSLVIIKQLLLLDKKCSKTVTKPVLKFNFIRKGNNMALVYGFSCKSPVDSDVVERRLRVNVNGNDVSNKSYSSTTTDFGEFSFNQNDDVVLILVDVDDAGNVSDPATIQFQALDTIPPKVPGGFSVSLLREIEDVLPTPAPTPAPVLETTPAPVAETTPAPVAETTPAPVLETTPEPLVTPDPSVE